jgi:hypothetical protein
MLANGGVCYRCIQQFGADGVWWQQDDAPVHGPGSDVIRQRFRTLDWPSHSPDLSRRRRAEHSKTRMSYSRAISVGRNEIGEDVIDNLFGSFRARCQVCVELERACFNGHWRRVHEVHHADDRSVPSALKKCGPTERVEMEAPNSDQLAILHQVRGILTNTLPSNLTCSESNRLGEICISYAIGKPLNVVKGI